MSHVVLAPGVSPASLTSSGSLTARCGRCGARLPQVHGAASRADDVSRRVAAVAIAALVLFPPAVTLPIMRIEEMGHSSNASIWSGSLGLLRHGDWFVGGTVFLCSIVFPLLKIGGLLAITVGRRSLQRRARRWSWRIVDLSGRWGMLDVLLVAVVVAWVKVGDLVEISPGPAAFAFTAVVLLSLLSAALFDPHALWADAPLTPSSGDPESPHTSP
ncbi:paraquat-inducible protein A [Saltatorellus ferox]|uniref:paraquat-inducible protein A n=1 Tax=Saltatorellus ferox TaxID=2528018 RepID=UPI003AF4046A